MPRQLVSFGISDAGCPSSTCQENGPGDKHFNSITHDHVHYAYMYTIGLRFITDQSPSLPLLAGDSDQEEDGESYEMESMARESRFGKGWRWTTTV